MRRSGNWRFLRDASGVCELSALREERDTDGLVGARCFLLSPFRSGASQWGLKHLPGSFRGATES